MIVPLYDYYKMCPFSIEELLKDYLINFYLKKYGKDKAEKVLYKASDCSRIKEVFGKSIQSRKAPDFNDFSIAISKTTWFLIQSDDTIALATIAAAVAWNTKINNTLFLKKETDLYDDIIFIFKKLNMVGEVSDVQYRVLQQQYIYRIISPKHEDTSNIESYLRHSIKSKIKEIFPEGSFVLVEDMDFERSIVTRLVGDRLSWSDEQRIANEYSINLDSLVKEEVEKFMTDILK